MNVIAHLSSKVNLHSALTFLTPPQRKCGTEVFVGLGYIIEFQDGRIRGVVVSPH